MGLALNFFKIKKPKKDYLLALDIGTEFVKTLIFKRGKEGAIIGVGREKQFPNYMRAGAVADIDGVAETCEKAIEKASQMARLRPKQAVMGISGELVKGMTTGYLYKRSEPKEEIDLAELKNVIQKIQWKAFEEARRELAYETGRKEIEIKLINAIITDIKIDGYRVTNPIGFKGQEIFLSIFNVYAPLVHLGALETIASKLNLDLLAIAAEPYAVARCLNLDSKRGAIIIDIGGGTTDIALVRSVGLEGTKTLALAGRAFTKRLSQNLGLDLDKAEEIKIKYSQRQLSQPVCRKIREIFKKDLRVWLSGVCLALEDFKETDVLPNQILLCGGGSNLPDLRRKLEKGFNKISSIKANLTNPKVSLIQPRDILDIKDETGRLKEPDDVAPMALASLALELVKEKGVLSSILKRTVRMMQR
jgi:cell division protein FtsA